MKKKPQRWNFNYATYSYFLRSGEEEKEKNLQYVREIRRKLKKPDQQQSPHKKPEQSPHYKKPEQLSPPILSQFSSAPMSSSSQQNSADLVMSDDSESSSSDENESDGDQSSENSAGSEDDIGKKFISIEIISNLTILTFRLFFSFSQVFGSGCVFGKCTKNAFERRKYILRA